MSWESFSRNRSVQLVFILIAISFFLFFDYIFGENLYVFVDIGGDSFNQYWPYLSFLSDMLHNGNFSFWNFEMGTGNSIFAVNMLLFDPFNILLIFFNKYTLPYGLVYIAIAKIIVGGFFFQKYLTLLKPKQGFTNMVFAIFYAYNGFFVLWGQHYQFATFSVFIALILYTLERGLKNNQWLWFSIAIGFAIINSYYMLYMLSFYLGLYIILRFFMLHSFNLKNVVTYIGKFFSYYVLGIGLGAVLFLPSLHYVFSNPRIASGNLKPPIFGDLNWQDSVAMFLRLFSNESLGAANRFYGPQNYYELIVLYSGLLAILVFTQYWTSFSKKNKYLTTIVGLFLVFCTISPFFVNALNGFSGTSYRWSFIIILFILFVAHQSLDIENLKLNNKVLLGTFIVITIGLISSLLIAEFKLLWEPIHIEHTTKVLTFAWIVLVCYSLLLVLRNKMSVETLKTCMLIVVIVDVFFTSYATENDRVRLQKSTVETGQYYFDGTAAAVDYLNSVDSTLYRIQKQYNSVFLNDSVFQHYNGLKAYTSLNSAAYIKFLQTMNIPFAVEQNSSSYINFINGFDSSYTLQSLFGVKYILSKEQAGIPPGYDLLKQVGDVYIYKNKNYLTFGYQYANAIDEASFELLTPEEKQQMLLQAVVIDKASMDSVKKVGVAEFNLDRWKNESRSQQLIPKAKVEVVGMDVTENNFPSKMVIHSSGTDPQLIIPFAQTQAQVKTSFTIDSKVATTGQIFWADNKDGFSEEKSLQFPIDGGKHNYNVPLNNISFKYLRLDIGNVIEDYTLEQVEFSETNDFKADQKQLQALRQTNADVHQVTGDYLTSTIDMKQSGLVYFSIPWEQGWHFYANGKPIDPIEANIGFTALTLQTGVQQLEMKYVPPYLYTGIAVTICSVIIAIGIYMKQRNTNKKMRVERKGETEE